jgi:hypothetical protein
LSVSFGDGAREVISSLVLFFIHDSADGAFEYFVAIMSKLHTPIHCVIIVKHFSKSKVRRLGTVNFLYPFVSKKMSTFDLTK